MQHDLLFVKYTLERSLKGKIWGITLGEKKGKDIFSVCVNKYFLSVLTVRPPRPYI